MSDPAMVATPDTRRRQPGAGGTDRLRWLAVLGLALLFIALRWGACDAPLIRDEGEYAYSARLLERGLPPYTYSYLQKPPMIIYTYALADLLGPGFLWMPRLLAYVSAALTTVLVGYIARREFGRGYAFPAMFLFTPMVLLPHLDQAIANTEMFMLAPLLGVVALFVRARDACGKASMNISSRLPSQTSGSPPPASNSPPDHWLWLVAGFCAIIALGYKYTAAPILAAVFALWSWQDWRKRGGNALIKAWLWGLAGGFCAGFAVFGYFLIKDGGGHLWECTVVFNRAYAASSTFSLSQLGHRLRQFWTDWWVLFLLLPGLLLKGVPAALKSESADEGASADATAVNTGTHPVQRGALWLWVGLFLASWVSTGASYYSQYYVVVMPFWSLLGAVAINRLNRWVSARFSWSEIQWRLILTTLTVTLICLPDFSRVVPNSQQRANDQFDPINPFPESSLVARRLAEITSPQDPVFIAGSEPQILYYARRFSPTRFVITYPMMIPSPLAEGYQVAAINDLKRQPPAAIVWSRWNTSWLRQPGSPTNLVDYLERQLAERYDRVGGYVLGNRSGRWVEPLPPQELKDASLVLYRRKPAAGG